VIRTSDGLIGYELSPIEIVGAFGLPPKAKLSNLVSVSVEANPWSSKVLRGIRAPGTGFPYLIMLGTMRHLRGKDFCVVYKRNPVLVLEFKNEKWARWVVPASPQNLAAVSEFLDLSKA
jgi:hypothetical protein